MYFKGEGCAFSTFYYYSIQSAVIRSSGNLKLPNNRTGLFRFPGLHFQSLCRQTDRHDSGFYMNTNITFLLLSLQSVLRQAGNVVIADEHATCADSCYDCLP